jgi:hypothetical protein
MPKSEMVSVLLHLAALAVLLILNSAVFVQPPKPLPAQVFKLVFTPPREPAERPAVQAGGANQDILRARRGAPPPRVQRAFIPPAVKPDPKLPLPMGVEFDAPKATLAASNLGDPLGTLGSNSLGTGGVNGLGNRG